MDELIANNEVTIRLGSFLGIFACMALWEILAPRRALTQPRGSRWLNNNSNRRINFPAAQPALPVPGHPGNRS